MKRNLTEIFGWYGVIAIVGAYALLTMHVFTVDNLLYQILNLTGAIGIMIDAYTDKNYQPVVLNIIWGGIALFAILNLILR